MTDWRLILNNLFARKLRAALMLVAIAIAFLLFGVLSAINTALNAPPPEGSNRMVTVNKISFTQTMPISYVTRVRSVEGIGTVSWANWMGAWYQEPRNTIVAFAVDAPTYLALYPELVLTPAERDTFLRERTSILVGQQLAEQYGWQVGQRVPIASNIYSRTDGSRVWDFTIAGIFRPASESQSTGFILSRWDFWNESISFGRDDAGNIIWTAKDPAQSAAVAQRIDTLFANSQAETKSDTEAAFNASFIAQIGNIALIITLVVGAAFLTILMIVGNTMVMAVRERTREVGVLKTLGFPDGRILRMVLGESLLLALLGGLIGLGLAFAVIAVIAKAASGFIAGLAITPATVLTALLFMVLLGLLTGAIPAWNAMRLTIVTALGRR
jgi:putative ABC transport system permease protein